MTLLALLLAASVQAAPGPALQALHAVADGASFDGAIPRREGPLLIVSEKEVLLRQRRLKSLSYDVYGSESDRLLYSRRDPPRTLRVWGIRQEVEIADRRSYVRRRALRGAVLAGLAGAALAAALVALANPVAGAIALAACAAAGALAGRDQGRTQPSSFSRVVRRRREISR